MNKMASCGRRRSNSPRILYVTTHRPDRGVTGAYLRSLNLLRALEEMGTVEVVVLHDDNPECHGIPEARSELRVAYTLQVEPRRNKTIMDKLRWTFDPRSDYPHGWGVGFEGINRVRNSLSQFDLIWFFKLRGADSFPNASWPCSVMDIDDVPSTYERAILRKGCGVQQHLLTRRRLFSW